MDNFEERTFRAGSTTYYWGAKFFPKAVRADVLRLYSFLRVADDYVDVAPPQAEKFRALRAAWERARQQQDADITPSASDTVDARVIKNIIGVMRKYDFDPAWVIAFWDSMQADLEGRQYNSLDDSLWYVYGSAEAVGLMMSSMLGLAPKARAAAMRQGRAMQWINFIRDLGEDTQLGRCYFPASDLQQFGLPDLREATACAHPVAFERFMRFEIQRYAKWQAEAYRGIHLLPGVLRPAIRTAANMYGWTAERIARDPMIVFTQKVKPRKHRIIMQGIANLVRP